MSCEEEVLAIRKQLEKMTETKDTAQALDLLKALGKLDINLNILTSTRIGMTVNALRKSSTDEETQTVAKSLIKAWKKLVPESSDKKEEKKKEEKREEKPKKASSTPSGQNYSLDEVRSSCRKLLLNAIKGEGDLPEGCTDDKCQDIATNLEAAIFAQFRQTSPKYKNQVRSRVFNLKDKKNPMLRINLLAGLVSAERLSKMTSEEMANDEVKKQREDFVKQGIDESRLAHVEGTTTDMLKCGKCRKSNCTYNQIQTRSADEPMTTFVLCNECGNRWKFC
jgi:transcription elongation factor S-II